MDESNNPDEGTASIDINEAASLISQQIDVPEDSNEQPEEHVEPTPEEVVETIEDQFFDINGEQISLNDLKTGFMKNADYTKKTQALSEERRVYQQNYIRYANQGATRNKPLSDDLLKRLAYLEQMGITAEVFSGGQDGIGEGSRRTGSTRHDHGGAGDIRFYQGDRRLSWANPDDLPIFKDIVSKGRAAGITGFGAGPGYMGEGTMHVGMGGEGVWGAGGKSKNAPGWLKDAFYGSSGSADPVSSTVIAESVKNKTYDPEVMMAKAGADTGPVVTTTTTTTEKSHNGPLIQAFNKITGKNVQVPDTIGGVSTDKVAGAFSGLGDFAAAMNAQTDQLNAQIAAGARGRAPSQPIELTFLDTEVPGLNKRKRRGGLGGIGGYLL